MVQQNKLFEVLLDVIPFASCAIDIQTLEVIYSNKLMLESMYAPREKMCYKKIFGQDEVCSWCNVEELKVIRGDFSNRKTSNIFFDEGSDKWYKSYDEILNWPDGRLVKYSVLVDISELKETQASMIQAHTKLALQSKKLKDMAQKDFLTGIHNRGHFFTLVSSIWESDKDIYVAMFDLDKFKNINDTYGHNAGDKVLKVFTKTISSIIDDKDIFGRLGGEEFALVSFSNEDNFMQKLEEIRAKTESLVVEHENQEIKFTVSIGVAQKEDNKNIDIVLDDADKKLYTAKTTGRNKIKFRV